MLFEDANSDATEPEIRIGNVNIRKGMPALSWKTDLLAHDANVAFPQDPPPSSGNTMIQKRHNMAIVLPIFEANVIADGAHDLK